MSREGAMLEDLHMMSALMGEVAMAYYYQHPDGRQRGPYMLPNTGGGNLEACGYEQVLLYTRPAAPSAVGVDEAERLADLLVKAPFGNTTIGNAICTEVTWDRLRPAVVAALTAALAPFQEPQA